MKAIGEIISNTNNQTKKHLKLVSDHSESQNKHQEGIFTSKEIDENDWSYNTDPEESIECKYCNSDLFQKGVVNPITNTVMAWLSHERCECSEATDYWNQYDEDKQLEEENKKREEERRRRKEDIEKLVGNSGIKKRFKSRTFDIFKVDSENEIAYNNSKMFADNFEKFSEEGEGLFYTGTFGTGKTHLAVSVALDLIDKGISVICMTSIDLLAEIKKTYDNNRNTSEHQILKAYKDVDLLVIDDLGKEYSSDWSIAMLYDIINHRSENCKSTIVTTNYSDDNLVDRLARKSNYETAGAIVSRLHEMTMGITLNGKDKRRMNI